MQGQKRGMIFFKWYGKNIENTLEIPEFHAAFKYIRTIGVSVFNKKQSTGKHYGPLRVTLRVLYNINDMPDKSAFIKVGNHINYWQDNKLFIFDDTLQHQSCNNSDGVRLTCMVPRHPAADAVASRLRRNPVVHPLRDRARSTPSFTGTGRS